VAPNGRVGCPIGTFRGSQALLARPKSSFLWHGSEVYSPGRLDGSRPSPRLGSSAVGSSAVDIVLVIGIGIALLWPVVWRVVCGRFDPFEPIVIFLAAYGVMFVVRPSAMLAKDEIVHYGPRATLDVSAGFTMMLTVAFLGALGFVAAYELSPRVKATRSICATPKAWDLDRVAVVAGILGGVGVIAFGIVLVSADGLQTLLLLFRGRSREFTEVIQVPSMYPWVASFVVVPAAMTALAIVWSRRTWMTVTLSVLLVAVVLLRTIPTGNRLVLLPLAGGVFVLYFIRRSARPSLITLVAVGIVAAFGSAFLSDLRGRSARGESTADTAVNLASNPSRVAAPLTTGPDTEMAATLSAAVTVITDHLGYQYGRIIFVDFLTRPVPRAVWPSKPDPPRDRLAEELWPVETQQGPLNPAFSVLMYFYWDFAIPGVVGGLALYGLVARRLYDYFLRHSKDIKAQVFYSLAVWFLVIALRDGPVDTTANIAVGLLPVLLIFRLASAWSARQERLSSRSAERGNDLTDA
jgi:hypothetical protein